MDSATRQMLTIDFVRRLAKSKTITANTALLAFAGVAATYLPQLGITGFEQEDIVTLLAVLAPVVNLALRFVTKTPLLPPAEEPKAETETK